MISIRLTINELRNKKAKEIVNKTKNWFYEKIHNVDKLLVILTKKKREKTQVTKIRNERGDSTTDLANFKRIIRVYCNSSQQIR